MKQHKQHGQSESPTKKGMTAASSIGYAQPMQQTPIAVAPLTPMQITAVEIQPPAIQIASPS